MTQIKHWLNDSIYTNSLSPGCKMCAEGAKMVVFITGLCPAYCFYCPLSLKKTNTDVIFADEWQLTNENDTDKLTKEALFIKAKGAGITGGDPLTKWERTNKYIQILKKIFGHSFHIHLYTSGLEHIDHIENLVDSGLNEIRFHPSPNYWNNMDKSKVKKAIFLVQKMAVDTAIEIPAIPNMKKDIIKLIHWADIHDIDWINLNELELSERNEKELYKRGFFSKNDVSSAVLHSQFDAYDIIQTIADESLPIGIHYCSSSFKDGIQLKNRIKRRAESIANPFDIITDEGTLLKGIIYVKNIKKIPDIISYLKTEFHLSEKEYIVSYDKKTIQVSIPFLESIAYTLSTSEYECYISESYPTADELEVERIPLR
jgi:uncharacterized protein